MQAQGRGFTFFDIKWYVGQQVNFIDDTDIGCSEHIGIFLRFVVTFRYREYDHAMGFPQVEKRGTNEVADVFNEQQTVVCRCQQLYGSCHHAGIEVTSLSRIDLHRRGGSSTDAGSVIAGLLVALYHRHGISPRQIGQRAFQYRCLSRAGRGYQVESGDMILPQQGPVLFRLQIILVQYIESQFHDSLAVWGFRGFNNEMLLRMLRYHRM